MLLFRDRISSGSRSRNTALDFSRTVASLLDFVRNTYDSDVLFADSQNETPSLGFRTGACIHPFSYRILRLVFWISINIMGHPHADAP